MPDVGRILPYEGVKLQTGQGLKTEADEPFLLSDLMILPGYEDPA